MQFYSSYLCFFKVVDLLNQASLMEKQADKVKNLRMVTFCIENYYFISLFSFLIEHR